MRGRRRGKRVGQNYRNASLRRSDVATRRQVLRLTIILPPSSHVLLRQSGLCCTYFIRKCGQTAMQMMHYFGKTHKIYCDKKDLFLPLLRQTRGTTKRQNTRSDKNDKKRPPPLLRQHPTKKPLPLLLQSTRYDTSEHETLS